MNPVFMYKRQRGLVTYPRIEAGEIRVPRTTRLNRKRLKKRDTALELSNHSDSPTSGSGSAAAQETYVDEENILLNEPTSGSSSSDSSEPSALDSESGDSEVGIEAEEALAPEVGPLAKHAPSTLEEAYILVVLLKWRKYGCTKLFLEKDLRSHRILFDSLSDRHESSFPHSVYQLRNLYPDFGQNLRLHYICSEHGIFLGSRTPGEPTNVSYWCDMVDNERHEIPLGNLEQSCMLTAKVEDYLRTVIQHKYSEVMANVAKRGKAVTTMHEFVQGKFYRLVHDLVTVLQTSVKRKNITKPQFCCKNCAGLTEHVLTLIVHSDGARVTDSSSLKAYAIHVVLAELDARSRLHSGFLHTVWVGTDKTMPHRNMLWKPFLDEMQVLQTEGFSVTVSGNEIRFRTVVVCVCADAAERFPLAELSSFHAIFGCTRCLQQTIVWKDPTNPRSHHQVYPFSEVGPRLRSHGETLALAEELLTFEPAAREDLRKQAKYKGVTGLSHLFSLRKLDIIRGLPVGYMHLFLKGIFPKMLTLFLTPGTAAEVDQRTASLDFPNCLARKPRSVLQLPLMKANEFLVFMIHGLHSFHGLLTDQRFELWALLTSLATTTTLDHVSASDIGHIEAESREFVKLCEKILGEEFMRYNVHQVLHLAECVRDFGPMSGYCELAYEDWIGEMLRRVKGYNNIPREMANTMILEGITAHLSERVRSENLPENLVQLLECLSTSKHHQIAKEEKGRVLLGKSRTSAWLQKQCATSHRILKDRARLCEEIHANAVCRSFLKVILDGYLISGKESYSDKNANRMFFDKTGTVFLLKHAVQFYQCEVAQGPTFLIAQQGEMLAEKPYGLKWHLPTFSVFTWSEEVSCLIHTDFGGVAVQLPYEHDQFLCARLPKVLYSMD